MNCWIVGVNEIVLMIDLEVFKSGFFKILCIVTFPAIREDYGAFIDISQNIIQECGGFAVGNSNQEALFSFSAYTAENPLLWQNTASIVFPLCEERFVNLHNISRT